MVEFTIAAKAPPGAWWLVLLAMMLLRIATRTSEFF
jgi:hypothetical protein